MSVAEIMGSQPARSPDDGDLLRRMARGDEQALEDLAVRFHRRLYTYLVRLVGDPSQAEELVQDVLMAAWRAAPRFRGEARVSTWLLSIAHHKAVDALRRRSPEDPVGETAQWHGLRSPEPEPHEVAEGREQVRCMAAALERLPGAQRATLELVFSQGLTLQEVATVLGVPVGTVKSRIHQARKRLREAMELEGGASRGAR